MSIKILLKNVRLSYANLFTPTIAKGASEPKYSASLIIPKDHPQIAELKAAIAAEATGRFGPDAVKEMAKAKSKLHNPLRDGDEEREKEAAYQGMFFMNSTSKRKPQVVDRKVQPILDEAEIFSGCYANVSVALYPFDVEGNKGIAAGLNNVQLVRVGERLGGAPNAEEEFEAMDDEDSAFSMD